MNAFAVSVQVPTGRIQLVDVRRRALLLAQLRMLLIGAVFLALAAASGAGARETPRVDTNRSCVRHV